MKGREYFGAIATKSGERPPKPSTQSSTGTALLAKQRGELSKQAAVISSLIAWYEAYGRHALPWRRTQNPYRILISELMLQQTQVSRVVPKYEAFIARFPDITSLAKAQRQEVLLLWQGLGYNSRAARLHALAKMLHESNAALPEPREELLKLPGIGPYTAGAIIIFSRNRPALSVDVNVERVLRRVFWPQDEAPAKADVDGLALGLIEASGQPRHWQSALMDLGSAVCTARSPKCDSCPLRAQCKSRGIRPDELRAIPKQSKFLGSTRWWRGQILKVLLQGPVSEKQLIYRIKAMPTPEEEDLFDAAIDGLVKEGIARKDRGLVSVS